MSVIMDQLKALILWPCLVLFLRQKSLISERRSLITYLFAALEFSPVIISLLFYVCLLLFKTLLLSLNETSCDFKKKKVFVSLFPLFFYSNIWQHEFSNEFSRLETFKICLKAVVYMIIIQTTCLFLNGMRLKNYFVCSCHFIDTSHFSTFRTVTFSPRNHFTAWNSLCLPGTHLINCHWGVAT